MNNYHKLKGKKAPSGRYPIRSTSIPPHANEQNNLMLNVRIASTAGFDADDLHQSRGPKRPTSSGQTPRRSMRSFLMIPCIYVLYVFVSQGLVGLERGGKDERVDAGFYLMGSCLRRRGCQKMGKGIMNRGFTSSDSNSKAKGIKAKP